MFNLIFSLQFFFLIIKFVNVGKNDSTILKMAFLEFVKWGYLIVFILSIFVLVSAA